VNERDRSTGHEQDALTFLEEASQAGATMAHAAGAGEENSYGEAGAMFNSAVSTAAVHATLAVAAAVRDLTNELEHHRLVP
jgi:hypothetical protein